MHCYLNIQNIYVRNENSLPNDPYSVMGGGGGGIRFASDTSYHLAHNAWTCLLLVITSQKKI